MADTNRTEAAGEKPAVSASKDEEKATVKKRKDEIEMQMKESELLYGTADKYGIYQLKDDPEVSRLRSKGTYSLKEAGILKENEEAVAIRPENYDLVYVGDMAELIAKNFGLDTVEDKLHALFEEFNIYQPKDYTGRPLSVSDIVVLHENGKNSAHYVDSLDYTEMPHFIRGLEGMKGKEQERQKSDDTRSEGGQVRQGSLREALEECKQVSAKEGKKQEKGR